MIGALFAVCIIGATIPPTPLLAQPAASAQGSPSTPLEELKEKLEASDPEKQLRPTQWGEPTEIQVGIYVIDVDEISSAGQNFSASIYYEIKWKNPLLKHDGPGPKIQRATSVWTPGFVIANQQEAWSAFPHFVEIMPDGQVTLRQKTWGWFSQPLNLRNFPLDRQKISFHLVSSNLKASHAKITSLVDEDQVQFSDIAQNFSLPDFTVLGWSAVSQPYNVSGKSGRAPAAGFLLELELKREPWYYVWKVILPLCLIVIMSWVPRWLDPKDSGTSIGLSATAFLTLVAYLFAINVLLPRVSYLTRIDWFILLSTFLVFAGLMHTALSSFWIHKGKKREIIFINRISRWIYPPLLFVIIFSAFNGAK